MPAHQRRGDGGPGQEPGRDRAPVARRGREEAARDHRSGAGRGRRQGPATKKVHDSYMAYKKKYDAWAGFSEGRTTTRSSRPDAVASVVTPPARGCDRARRPRRRRDRPRRVVADAGHRGADGDQRAAALCLLDRLGVVAGARVAPARAAGAVRHDLRAAAGRARARRHPLRALPERTKRRSTSSPRCWRSWSHCSSSAIDRLRPAVVRRSTRSRPTPAASPTAGCSRLSSRSASRCSPCRRWRRSLGRSALDPAQRR